MEGYSYQCGLRVLEDVVNMVLGQKDSPRGQETVMYKEIDQISKCTEDNGSEISQWQEGDKYRKGEGESKPRDVGL